MPIPAPAIAMTIIIAPIVVLLPRVDTAPVPEPNAIKFLPPEVVISKIPITATIVDAIATTHATFPVALILIAFLERSPSISIVSSLFFIAFVSSSSVVTFAIISILNFNYNLIYIFLIKKSIYRIIKLMEYFKNVIVVISYE